METAPDIVRTAHERGAAAPSRIERVDSLRALAMLAVIAEHTHLLPCGWMGVWLFFVISGFVVTTSLVARGANDDRRADTFAFFARRSARILPIYDLYIVAGLAVTWLGLHHLAWRPFVSLLLMYNNFAAAFGQGSFPTWPAGHLWTISVEWQFYLVYGCLFLWAPRRWVVGACLATIVADPLLRVLAGAVFLQHQAPLEAAFSVYSFSVLHFDAFAMGALLALFRDRLTTRGAIRAGVVGLVLLGAYLLVYATIDHAHGAHGVAVLRNLISGILIGQGREGPLYSIVDLLAAALLVVSLDERVGLPLVGSRRLQFVGRISYGGYVYHQLALWLFAALVPPAIAATHGWAGRAGYDVAAFSFGASVTIALAAASYRWFERPLMRRVGRALDRAPRRHAAAAPARRGFQLQPRAATA